MAKIQSGTSKALRESDALPESRRFNDPDPKAAEAIRNERFAGTHVNGEPFEEWAKHMPTEVVDRMMYSMTDEGLAQYEKTERERDMRLPSGAMADNPTDKGLLQRRDFLQREDVNPGAAPDPRATLANKYVEPGMRPKFIDPKNVHAGMDPRGWEVVKDDKGQPVMHGKSVLAQMPDRQAAAMQRQKQQRSEELVSSMSAAGAPNTTRGGEEVRVMRPGEALSAGI